MRFDSIKSKLDRLNKEAEMKCNMLRDNIKTTKLKLSLSEMEYKEFVNAGKKQTQYER